VNGVNADIAQLEILKLINLSSKNNPESLELGDQLGNDKFDNSADIITNLRFKRSGYLCDNVQSNL
jgi:hypothetical protein